MRKILSTAVILVFLFNITCLVAFAGTAEKPSFIYGDVNGDSKFNSTDYSLLKRHILGTYEIKSENALKAADVNADGQINSIDYSLFKRRLLDKIDAFPTELTYEISNEVQKGNSKFAFNIFRQLNKEDEDKSVFISPLSISTALTMTYQGARNQTAQEIAEALAYQGIDIKDLNNYYRSLLEYLEQADDKIKLDISNSIWLNENADFNIEDVNKDFVSNNKDVFKADFETADFSKDSEVERLNEWVSDATEGMIPHIVNKEDVIDSVMDIINAIYFKGDWAQKFDPERTNKAFFYTEDGEKTEVSMMNMREEIYYGEGTGFKVVRLPYGSGKTAMYCVLPSEGTSISEFVEAMNAEKWETIKESIAKRETILNLPKFKVEYGVKKLKDSLRSLGMQIPFTGSADFSGICEERNLYIDDVLHKAVIEVNEEGSEAAAVTVVIIRDSAVHEPNEFNANRPFMFVIEEVEHGTILFMGKILEAPIDQK